MSLKTKASDDLSASRQERPVRRREILFPMFQLSRLLPSGTRTSAQAQAKQFALTHLQEDTDADI